MYVQFRLLLNHNGKFSPIVVDIDMTHITKWCGLHFCAIFTLFRHASVVRLLSKLCEFISRAAV